ncbi:unnamed protein product, partial [Symbiodinium sp. CCMP2456]
MTFSAINVQSLNAFVDDGRAIGDNADVLIYTETAATTFVQQKMTKAARKAGKHVCLSHPVDKRTFKDHRDCITKGQSQGAAIVSSAPLRSSSTEWPQDIWKTARVVDTMVVTEFVVVMVIAIYGYHRGFPDAATKNEELFRAAVHKASVVRCPALMLGDLNCDLQSLAVWDAMVQEGWSDAAMIQSQMDGKPMANTFQETSRLDYILMNNLARMAFQGFGVSEQNESDHRAVYASFAWDSIPKHIWTYKSPMDTSKLDLTAMELQEAYVPAACLAELDQAIQHKDIEEAWTKFCKAYEQGVSFSLQRKNGTKPDTNFFGRGTMVLHKQTTSQEPCRRARIGDFQPSGDENTRRIQLTTRGTKPWLWTLLYKRGDPFALQQGLADPFVNGGSKNIVTGKSAGDMVSVVQGQLEQALLQEQQLMGFLLVAKHMGRRYDRPREYLKVVLYTYVDDWIMLSRNMEQLKDAMHTMEKLANKFGLLLSTAKSAVFATNNKITRQLHAMMMSSGINIGVCVNFAGLGISFQTAKAASTTTRNSRWDKARKLMERLQYMPWTQQRKTDIISRAILPLLFYGVENVVTGKDFLREVRSKCNHTVWGKQQYHLHFLTPLFSGTIYEPFLYIADKRFKAMLRAVSLDSDMVKTNWRLSLEKMAYFKRKTRGPMSILQNQLNDMGWEMEVDGKCNSPTGHSFYIWDISVPQFKQVVMESWEKSLLQHLNIKVNLEDLQSFSIQRTRADAYPDPMIQGFMRKVKLGGLFPNHRLHHVTKGETTCSYCGVRDTLEHRVFSCPATEEVRATDKWDLLKDQPKHLLLGGLSPQLPLMEQYSQMLQTVPEPQTLPLMDDDDVAEFFTDGSAIDSSNAITRLCSWSVTQAKYMDRQNKLISSGILPGKLQTVFRAELFAVIVVLALQKKSKIYCDNAAVVRDIQHLQQYGYQDLKWSTHADKDLMKT